MLVLRRKVGQWIRVGEGSEAIYVYLVTADSLRPQIGIYAPDGVPIVRGELLNESPPRNRRDRRQGSAPAPANGAPPVCRVCGCTDDDCSGCIERTGRPCHWVERDLCSACCSGGTQA